MDFICHVILQYHKIKALDDFMTKSLSVYITILGILVILDTMVVKT